MNHGLNSDIINKIQSVIHKYPQVNSVVLYGSRAKGTAKEGSDIDITLKGDNISLHALNQICNNFDDLMTPYNFDVSIFHDIENKELLEHIERVGIELITQ